jgi:hypothetical protein
MEEPYFSNTEIVSFHTVSKGKYASIYLYMYILSTYIHIYIYDIYVYVCTCMHVCVYSTKTLSFHTALRGKIYSYMYRYAWILISIYT